MRLLVVCLVTLASMAAGSSLRVEYGDTLVGQVTDVVDGDTFVLQLNKPKMKVFVRLSEIDTPERGHVGFDEATWALAEMVFERIVVVSVVHVDSFGRAVGRVFQEEVDVNGVLVLAGLAVVDRRFSIDPLLLELEARARTARRGLWAIQQKRSPSLGATQGRIQNSMDSVCGSKTTCSQMRSCAEAVFFFTQCGLLRLDRDGDGVPCERLC